MNKFQKKKRSIIKRTWDKKVVKKRGGMMRRGRPAPLNSSLLGQEELERDARQANARNIDISTHNSGPPRKISLTLPNKAKTVNPSWISPTSTLPVGMNYRGDDMGKYYGHSPDEQLEYNLDYDYLIHSSKSGSNEISSNQRDFMHEFVNALNFDKVTLWYRQGEIPKEFTLINTFSGENVRFKFRNINDAYNIISQCPSENPHQCIFYYLFGSIILKGGLYKKKNNIIKKKKVEKKKVENKKVGKSTVKKRKVEKKKVEKKKVEKKKVEKNKSSKLKKKV